MRHKELVSYLVLSLTLHLVIFSALGRHFQAADFFSPSHWGAKVLTVNLRERFKTSTSNGETVEQSEMESSVSIAASVPISPSSSERQEKTTRGESSGGQAGATAAPAEPVDVGAQRGFSVAGPAPYYYPSRMLQISPVPDMRLVFDYPSALAGSQGRVVMGVYINERGGTDRSEILDSTDDRLAEISKLVIDKARYRPGILGDRFVKSYWVVEITFSPQGSEATINQVR